jgi:hypothetical protein
MSDPILPPDDDLVSAVLDDEATPEERARVAADPRLQARLEELRAASAFVATPVEPPPAGAADRAVATAIAGRDRSDEVTAAVVPLRPWRDPRHILAAAAVLVFLVGIGALLSQADWGGDDSGSGGDAALTADTGGSDESSGGAEAGDATAEESPDAFALAHLGAVADDDELRLALEREGALGPAPERSTTSDTTTLGTADSGLAERGAPVPGESVECQVRLEEADPALDEVLLQATATFAGTPAVVYVYPAAGGGQLVVVVSEDGCEVLSSFAR